MSKKISTIRGMNDLLPQNSELWLAVEKTIADLFMSYGYKYIRTPIVEKTDTFCRAIGEITDIVEKEMYSWIDTSGESLSLRPEGTAGCVRAMIEHNLPREGIQKVFYQGAMFRRERPQKGRYRQFHQIGAEIFGANDIKADVELVTMINSLWQKLGLENITLQINSLGLIDTREDYKKILVEYFNTNKEELDRDSLRRLSTNPLRILDSKNKDMQAIINNAPKIIDYLDEKSKKYFSEFKEYLEYLNIPYKINPHLVRGLDYYNDVVFEFTTTDLGSQDTICAGGRYNSLVEKMGGNNTPAVGFAIGVERLILLIEEQKLDITASPLSIYLIANTNLAQLKSIQIANDIRTSLPHVILYNDISLTSFKSQFKKADKINADYALIVGEEELNNNQISIKPLKTKDKQQTMSIKQIISYLEKKL